MPYRKLETVVSATTQNEAHKIFLGREIFVFLLLSNYCPRNSTGWSYEKYDIIIACDF